MKKQCIVPSLILSLVVFLFSTSTLLIASEVPYISTADLKKKMDAGEALTLANALSPIEHKELAIKGSVNIPASKVKAHPNLPADKASLLIFYCKGPKCGKSRIAATKAVGLGYSNVMVYNEGLPAWAKNKYPLMKKTKYPKVKIARLKPNQVQSMQDSIIILDIRGKKHKKLGKITGTVNILLDNMEEQYTSLPKDKKIVVADHAGKQVMVTAKFLYMNGYTDVAVMDGGVISWIRGGLPVSK